jgi:integrase
MRVRGTGRVFRRRYKATDGTRQVARTWSLEWYDPKRGVKVREGTGLRRQADAEGLLRKRLGDRDVGRPTGPQIERTTFDELARLIEDDYIVNARDTVIRLRQSLAHLRARFAGLRAVEITEERIAAYTRARIAEGAANATVNRELAALKRAFRLGERLQRVARRPYIAMLKEASPRKGFFEPTELEALLAQLPESVQAVVEVAYITGWRVTSEILTRQWKHVDFANGWLRLEPGETKNGDGRMFPLTPWLRAVLERERRRTEALERGMGQIIPWVFHRDGEGIRYFRRRWLTACKAAGFARPIRRKDGRLVWLPTRIPHDFRRTAVRNLERAGVPRSAAMAMVGHKTEAIYRRYAIADEKMLREGAARLAAFIEPARGQRAKASGPVSGPVAELRARKLVAWDGVEPPTRGFSVRCSTN